MTLQAFRCGANILAYEKNNKKYMLFNYKERVDKNNV